MQQVIGLPGAGQGIFRVKVFCRPDGDAGKYGHDRNLNKVDCHNG